MHNSRKGFTLAEVLVTLAIIGVVAALTIPTLIQSTTNSKFTTALKKDIGVLNEAVLSLSADSVSFTAANSGTGALLATLFSTKLNVIGTNPAANNDNVIYLADGTKIAFISMPTGPTACPEVISADNATAVAAHGIGTGNTGCMAIIDVNGDKGPNDVATPTSLSDVYVVAITPTRVVPVTTTTALFAGSAFGTKTVNNADLAAADQYSDAILPLGASVTAVTN